MQAYFLIAIEIMEEQKARVRYYTSSDDSGDDNSSIHSYLARESTSYNFVSPEKQET